MVMSHIYRAAWACGMDESKEAGGENRRELWVAEETGGLSSPKEDKSSPADIQHGGSSEVERLCDFPGPRR